jgi:hypothetical protein
MNYIVSIHYNNPEFIEIQYKTIQKFIKGKYKYIVFNDGTNFSNEINNKCNELNIECIIIDQNIHNDRNLVFPKQLSDMRILMNNPSETKIYDEYWSRMNFNGYNSELNNSVGCRHCDSIQYIINYFVTNIHYNTKYLFNIDADMFFIDYLDINSFMENCHIANYFQGKKINEEKYWNYIWPNIFILNFEICPNLNEICFDGVYLYDKNVFTNVTDTGGETGNYLEKYKETLVLKNINNKSITDDQSYIIYKSEITNKLLLIFLDKMNELNNNLSPRKEILLNDIIVHFMGAGSNWINKSREYNEIQTKIFRNIFDI